MRKKWTKQTVEGASSGVIVHFAVGASTSECRSAIGEDHSDALSARTCAVFATYTRAGTSLNLTRHITDQCLTVAWAADPKGGGVVADVE